MRKVYVTRYTLNDLAERHEESQRLNPYTEEAKARYDAFQKALVWASDTGADDFWAQDLVDLWTNALGRIGFYDAKFNWTGFGNQGDGASFVAAVDIDDLVDFFTTDISPSVHVSTDSVTGKEDFRGWLIGKIGTIYDPKFSRVKWLKNDISMEVARRDHHYCHEHTCRLDWDLSDDGDYAIDPSDPDRESVWVSKTPRCRKLVTRFAQYVEALRMKLCAAFYSDLSAEWDDRHSEEYVLDTAEANGWEFDEDGKFQGYYEEDSGHVPVRARKMRPPVKRRRLSKLK